jgi:predicted ATPase
MLTKLKLTNFKPFGSQERPNSKREARLAPITLIYGPNSSGKSSIGQSLRMMAQTLKWLRSSPGGILSWDLLTSASSGDAVDLGNFVSVVHKHEESSEIKIEVTISDTGYANNNRNPFAKTFAPPRGLLHHRISLTYIRREDYNDPDEEKDVGILSDVSLHTSVISADRNNGKQPEGGDRSCLLVLKRRQSKHDMGLYELDPTHRSIADEFRVDGLSSKSLASALAPTFGEKSRLLREYERSDRYNPAPDYFNDDFNPSELNPDSTAARKSALIELRARTDQELKNVRTQLKDLKSYAGIKDLKEVQFHENRLKHLKEEAKEIANELLVFFNDELNHPNAIRALEEKASYSNFNVRRITGLERSLLPIGLTLDNERSEVFKSSEYSDTDQHQQAFYEVYAGRLQAYLIYMEDLLTKSLGSIRYVPPVRPMPKRLYSSDELRINQEVLDNINKQLKLLEVDYTINIKKINDEVIGNAVALELIDNNGTKTALTDVGFGISQLLPMLREGIHAKLQYDLTGRGLKQKKRDRETAPIVIVEQPELHLHPRLQANLADFFIACSGIDTPEDYKNSISVGFSTSQVQWLIESHSETLLLRLKRRIREKKIRASDVCVLYVYRDELAQSSRVMEIELSEDGEFLTEWPDGFFDDGYRELFETEVDRPTKVD